MATFYATGGPQIPYSPDLKYIAKGSFGCVVKPGLPNKGPDNINWKQYPKNVSKIFRHKLEYNKGINSTRKAYNIMGSNSAHRMNKYNYQYTARNLPKSIRNKCALSSGENIYVSRLPNLGISLFDLNGNTDAIDKLHRISFILILEQVKKVLEQVKKLQDAKYVHGDIREANVMIDPSDGRISIIDFDWLLPKDRFFSEFPLGFYNSPPETIVHKYLSDIQNITQSIILSSIRKNLPAIDYYNQSVIYFLGSNVPISQNISEDDFKDIIIENIKYYNNKLKLYTLDRYNKSIQINNELFKTYDSYSIGFSLLYMMNILYPGLSIATNTQIKESIKGKLYDGIVEYEDSQLSLIAKSIVSLKDTLKDLCNIDANKRTTIDVAIKIVNDEIRELNSARAIKQVANALKNAEKELKGIPVPPPAPMPMPMPTAPPMSPINNKAKKLPNLPKSPNSLTTSSTSKGYTYL